jgi:exosome complex RNA-binding protein Rrp42 (RNase PH superfamily)
MSNLAKQSTAILYGADSRVMAQVSAAVVKPYDDSPFEGIFTISTEFSPMASSSFEPARVGPYELILSRTLDNTLRRARALDLESLCILAKKLVWSVRVDVHFLDHDGGLVDAACVAVIAALSAFRREDVEIRGEEVEIVWTFRGLWLTTVPFDRATAGEVGDITYPTHNDIFILSATCTACYWTSHDVCCQYIKRRESYSP